MNIEIKNVSFTSASFTWAPNHYLCPGNFYRIMYHPNWNTILSGFSRQNFQQAQTVSLGRHFVTLQRLMPSTNYILCITCQGVHPSREQCTVFHTMGKDAMFLASQKFDLAMVVWLASSILLIIIAILLLYGCLKLCSKKCKRIPKGYRTSGTINESGAGSYAWYENKTETGFVDGSLELPTVTVLDHLADNFPDGLE
uniref:Fibronectin type III domain containing 9 n=2 Tax=Latimeria chalumnae TaxID=7897 RepID=H3A9G1_LATCH